MPRRAPVRLVARRVAIIGFWLVVWELAALVVGKSLILPGPVDTLVSLWSLLCGGKVAGIVWFSFSRIVGGFLVAFLAGLVLGAVAASHALVRDLLRPVMTMLKSTPVVCIVVLLLIWFGSTNVSAVAVCLVVFPAIWFTVVEGLSRLDKGEAEMLDVFGVHGPRRVLVSVWPQLLPYLVSISETVVGMSWKAGVAAELIGVPLGSMGERIYQSKLLLETADLFAWTIVIILLAYVCERIFLKLLRASGGWAQAAAVPRGATAHHTSDVPAADLSFSGADLGYGDHVVLHDLTRAFPAGSRTVLLDESGSGKTTLLRALASLDKPLGGGVSTARPVSMSFQGTRLIEALSARDNVALVADRVLSPDEISMLLEELLPRDVLDRPVSELSGGQRQRVELARACAHPSRELLLDEPFTGLDEGMHAQAASFVSGHAAGRTLVVATHDAADAAALDARVDEPLPTGATHASQ